jgi:hypothetical protein
VHRVLRAEINLCGAIIAACLGDFAMNKYSTVAAILSCFAMLASVVFARDVGSTYEGEIHGRVAILGEVKGPTEINVGGLLIVNIRDSGSRPPTDMKVDVGSAFKRVGQVRGINVKDGRPLMGGGYTWFLLSPRQKGTHQVKVSYVNADKETVRQKYIVEVTEAND